MASTSLATERLRVALRRLPDGWVLLHGGPAALTGGGDVDLAVSGRAVPFLERLTDRLTPDLTPIVSLEHDEGEWTTVFADLELNDFVQVDVASGALGAYGVHCARLQGRAVESEGLRVLPDVDQLLYRLIKGVSKGQFDRAHAIRQELQIGWQPEEVEAAVINNFVPWARRWLTSELGKPADARFSSVPRRKRTQELRRKARRILVPPGATVGVPQNEIARLSTRLEAATVRQVHAGGRSSLLSARLLRARGDLVVSPVEGPGEPVTVALARYVAGVWERRR